MAIHPIVKKEWIIKGSKGKPILIDAVFPTDLDRFPLLIFCHGFKGFKDWGPFSLIAEQAAKQGVAWVKFNFSWNGTTPENPTEFSDENAFGNNNFSYELNDAKAVLQHLKDDVFWSSKVLSYNILGHSRGGGIAVLVASQEGSIARLITWASVNEFLNYWTPKELADWERDKVLWIENKRTGQKLPMYYQIRADYYANLATLHIPTAVRNLQKPFLIIHGTADEAVPVSIATQMASWNSSLVQLELIENANHTFGGRHPFAETALPIDSEKALALTLKFILQEHVDYSFI
jgi:uncharacterized protein